MRHLKQWLPLHSQGIVGCPWMSKGGPTYSLINLFASVAMRSTQVEQTQLSNETAREGGRGNHFRWSWSCTFQIPLSQAIGSRHQSSIGPPLAQKRPAEKKVVSIYIIFFALPLLCRVTLIHVAAMKCALMQPRRITSMGHKRIWKAEAKKRANVRRMWFL